MTDQTWKNYNADELTPSMCYELKFENGLIVKNFGSLWKNPIMRAKKHQPIQYREVTPEYMEALKEAEKEC